MPAPQRHGDFVALSQEEDIDLEAGGLVEASPLREWDPDTERDPAVVDVVEAGSRSANPAYARAHPQQVAARLRKVQKERDTLEATFYWTFYSM